MMDWVGERHSALDACHTHPLHHNPNILYILAQIFKVIKLYPTQRTHTQREAMFVVVVGCPVKSAHC